MLKGTNHGLREDVMGQFDEVERSNDRLIRLLPRFWFVSLFFTFAPAGMIPITSALFGKPEQWFLTLNVM